MFSGLPGNCLLLSWHLVQFARHVGSRSGILSSKTTLSLHLTRYDVKRTGQVNVRCDEPVHAVADRALLSLCPSYHASLGYSITS